MPDLSLVIVGVRAGEGCSYKLVQMMDDEIKSICSLLVLYIILVWPGN